MVANTEFFDGTSWTEVADLATGKSRFSDSTQSALSAFAAGSNPSTGTEEWNAPAPFASNSNTNSELIWQIIKT
jgi:hypothetical protein